MTLAGCSSEASGGEGGASGAARAGGASEGGAPSGGGSAGSAGTAAASSGALLAGRSGGGTSSGGGSLGAGASNAGSGGKSPATAGDNAGPSGAGGSANGGSAGIAGASNSGGRAGSSAGGTGGDSAGTSGASGSGGTANTCPPTTPLTGGRRYCSNSTGNAAGNYSYELWAEGSGSGCMNVYGKDATFGATWTNVEDLLARVGLQFDRTRTHTQIGTISAEFAETKTGSTSGLTYVGVYGWTVNPLREYYILDDWGDTKPAGVASDGTPRDSVGTIVVDGETYDVWKKTRENKPSIEGTRTFDQYFSIRRTARQCGHISVSEHFSKWEELGLPFGNLTEAKLLLEAQDNSGTIEFTTARVVVE